MNENYYLIEKAISYLDSNFKNQPSLEDLSKELHVSPFHLQKVFKEWAGISPKKFLQFLTVEYAKDKLKDSNNVLETTIDSGLSSTSRLHELFVNIEAVTPAQFKTKGQDLEIYYGFHESIFGSCLIGVTKFGLCWLSFIAKGEEESGLKDLKLNWQNAKFIEDSSLTKKYFELIFGKAGSTSTPIKLFLKGTPFQVQVWKALLKIPKGNLTTYENIAKQIGSPKALRAVGTAVGRNPISFLIPCHRVINKVGVVGNYRWGRMRKKAMLGWEAGNQLSITNYEKSNKRK